MSDNGAKLAMPHNIHENTWLIEADSIDQWWLDVLDYFHQKSAHISFPIQKHSKPTRVRKICTLATVTANISNFDYI